MNATPINVQSTAPTKHVFSKNTALTMSIALFVLAAAILGRSIFAMIWSQKLNVYQCLYQLFGSGSVPVVNMIIGVLTACVLVIPAIGLLSARRSVNSNPPHTAGFSLLKTGLIIGLVYTSLAIITSFASVNVINRSNIEGYVGVFNMTAVGQFVFTLLFGTAAVCAEISMLRLFGAMTVNLQSGTIVKTGSVLSFVAGVVGLAVSAIGFCIKLFLLVTPPANYIQNIQADKVVVEQTNAELLINAFNVIIFATAVIIFVCIMMLAGSYAVQCDDMLRAARGTAYNTGRSVVNPQAIPDYAGHQNYDYHQSPNFTPYYAANQTYQTVNSNIYNGTVPPVPTAPENPFMPKTQYPNGTPAQNPAVNPAASTDPAGYAAPVNPSPFANQAAAQRTNLDKPDPNPPVPPQNIPPANQ